MNKSEFIAAVAEASGYSQKTVGEMLDAISTVIKQNVKKKEEISLGFAKVKTVDKAEKQGVNPATGKPMTIPAKTVVKIVPGKALNNAANGVK